MILTVTPNPSIDRTVMLPATLRRGAVHRADAVLFQPGGKGVNISRACVAAGVPTIAVLPVAADDSFVAELGQMGVQVRPAPPTGPMRINLTITEPDGTTTKINTAGASVEQHDLARLAEIVLGVAAETRPGWVVLAGSLPPGAPADWYAGVGAALHADGHRFAVDTSDAPLAALLDGNVVPDLIKPNAEELASVTAGDPAAFELDPAAAAAAAATLAGRLAGTVLATLGAAGAVLVDADGAWHATPPPTTVVSTVGAGDASLFGYLLADLRGAAAPERLASAVAYGAAAAGLPGTTPPTPTDVRTADVRVSQLDIPPSPLTEGTPSWQN
ncbi:hexose kinase [Nocardioides sp. HM23]|uniref:1-phosphofructokinase family hexose kinase n=1 Tax=Nocardioides bizhenqiangii TaxID=3095076 RepID=UPI002ACA95BD|nr:hexose kinase [Nocardioides sp. HM23]MDZ5620849.1 hexose kinase [Nocardioides sp. HM23]